MPTITPHLTKTPTYDLPHLRQACQPLHHTWPRLQPRIYHTWDKHANHYTTPDQDSNLGSTTLETSMPTITPHLTKTPTYDLPHLRQACQPLHHTWPRLKPTIYHTWGKHANHYTTPDQDSNLGSTTLETSMPTITPHLTKTPTYDLPHLRQACQPLHHTWPRLQPRIYHTWDKHANHYTTPDQDSNLRSTTLETSMPTITPHLTKTPTYDLPLLRQACQPLHHTWPRLQPRIYHTWGKHANHYTTPDQDSNLRSTTLEASMPTITPHPTKTPT